MHIQILQDPGEGHLRSPNTQRLHKSVQAEGMAAASRLGEDEDLPHEHFTETFEFVLISSWILFCCKTNEQKNIVS